MPDVATKEQMALGETALDDSELESLLEAREQLKEELSVSRRAYNEVDEQAKGQGLQLEIPEDATRRCGRFQLGTMTTETTPVSFEREAKTKATIRVVKER